MPRSAIVKGTVGLHLDGTDLLGVGFLMMNWASSRNLKDVAVGAALGAGWTLLWKRQRPGVPEELTSRLEEVRAQDTHVGKAKVVTGYAIKHVIAQVVGLAGLVLFAFGALLLALGIFWH
jgi:hypothetical protein